MNEIIVHLQCSYKDGGTSPSGFSYGTIVFSVVDNNDINENYIVSTEKKSVFVRDIFDSDKIRKTKGKNGDSYYFIVKRLKYTYSDKKDVTISIGFEFSNSAEYKTFCQSFEKHENPRGSGSFDSELCKKLADCIIVDRKKDYGYVVDKKLFNAFVDDMLSSKTENVGEKQNFETDEDVSLMFVLKSKSADYSKDLKSLFGFDEMPERKENSPVYIFGKKKTFKGSGHVGGAESASTAEQNAEKDGDPSCDSNSGDSTGNKHMAGNSSNSRPGGSKKVSDKTQGEVRQDKGNDWAKIILDVGEKIIKKENARKLEDFLDNLLNDKSHHPANPTTPADDSPEEEEKP